jgi:hypothetical protein
MQFRDLLDQAKITAIQNALSPTETSVWSQLCRTYSKTFHTPLHLVETLDPEIVLQAVFENQLESFDPEKDLQSLYDQLRHIEDPDWEETEEEDLQDFIKKTEKAEAKRVKEGRAIKGTEKSLPKMPTLDNKPTLKDFKDESDYVPKPGQPTGGKLNMDWFNQNEEA